MIARAWIFISARASSSVCSRSREGCEANLGAEFACRNSPTCFIAQRVARGPFDGHFRPTSFHGLAGSRLALRFDRLPRVLSASGPSAFGTWYAQRAENNRKAGSLRSPVKSFWYVSVQLNPKEKMERRAIKMIMKNDATPRAQV